MIDLQAFNNLVVVGGGAVVVVNALTEGLHRIAQHYGFDRPRLLAVLSGVVVVAGAQAVGVVTGLSWLAVLGLGAASGVVAQVWHERKGFGSNGK